jgi:hypothetical protein
MDNVGIWINGEALSEIRLEIKLTKLFTRIMEVMTVENASKSIAFTIQNLAILPTEWQQEMVVDRLLVSLEELVKKNEH